LRVHPTIEHLVCGRFSAPVSIAPLVVFRILFGGLMAYGAIRFMLSGWVETLYVEPQFFFKFWGFGWVQPLSAGGMYVVYTLMSLTALGIAFGALYRLSAIGFFLLFSYTELIDATNYLNHYYLVILLAFWMIWLPAGRAFSVDNWWGRHPAIVKVPAWTIGILIVQLCLTYFFAGIAKLHPDWLLRGMPLAVWLPEHADLPLIGGMLQTSWAPLAFSWAGALYDLTIPFWLLNRSTRPFAYLAVLGFHLLTWVLFNIGLFPLIMMSSTLIFFSAEFHQNILAALGYRSGGSKLVYTYSKVQSWLAKGAVGIFFLIQLFLPLRHWLYPGDVLWTEEGYRLSWRVMLVEKTGHATFTVLDRGSTRKSEVQNGHYLTDFQEKQMSIQPDFMLQYARFLADQYEQHYGFRDPIVTVDAHVALNGRSSQRLIDPEVDLAGEPWNLLPRDWILPRQQDQASKGQLSNQLKQ
jgi:hypothetical protein